ncbi:MAG: hypothetical protein ABW144_19845 [Candidatus Thiodiazotropha sp.]
MISHLSFLTLLCASDTIKADEAFWFQDIEPADLPAVDDQRDPLVLAGDLKGTQALPDHRGRYVFYQHGGLWYWFGPFEKGVGATSTFRTLRARVAALKARNPLRYAEAHVARFNARTDDSIIRVFERNPNSLRFSQLFGILDGLEQIDTIEADLKNLDSQAKVAPSTSARLLEQLRAIEDELSIVALVTGGDSDELAVLQRRLGETQVLSGAASDALRRALALRFLKPMMRTAELDRLTREGALPSEALRLRFLASDALKAFGMLKQDIDNALGELDAITDEPEPPERSPGGIPVERVLRDIGAALLAKAAETTGLPTSRIRGPLRGHDLDRIANGFQRLGRGELDAAIANARRELESTGDGRPENSGVLGPSSLPQLILEEQAGSPSPDVIERGADLVRKPLSDHGIDVDTAAVLGLNAQAAHGFAKGLAELGSELANEVASESVGGDMSATDVKKTLDTLGLQTGPNDPFANLLVDGVVAADRSGFLDEAGRAWARKKIAQALKTSIAATTIGQDGQHSRKEATPHRFADAVHDYLVERNAGNAFDPDMADGMTPDQILDAAAKGMAGQLLPDPNALMDDKQPTLDGSEVGDVIGLVGGDPAAKGNNKGRPSGSRQGSNDGDDSGGSNRGQAKRGSGLLPLPGSMPLFETTARVLARYFGVDMRFAKQVLLAAYMIDPKAFENLASELEQLHDHLVSAEAARAANDVNKMMELLDQIENAAEALTTQMDSLLSDDVNEVLEILSDAGLKAFTKEGLKKLSVETGLSPAFIQAILQVPRDFDATVAQKVVVETVKKEIENQLIELGTPPEVAHLLAKNRDLVKAREISERVVNRAANDFLRRQGLDPEIWSNLENGDVEKAVGRLGVRVEETAREVGEELIRQGVDALESEGRRRLGERLGIGEASVDTMMNLARSQGTGAAGDALQALASSELRTRVSAAGLPAGFTSAVLSGDANLVRTQGRQFVGAKIERHLRQAGLSVGAARKAVQGDWMALVTDSEDHLKARLESLSRNGLLPTRVADQLAAGDVHGAFDHLVASGTENIDLVVSNIAVQALGKVGVPTATWEALRSGDVDTAAGLLRPQVDTAVERASHDIRQYGLSLIKAQADQVAAKVGLSEEALNVLTDLPPDFRLDDLRGKARGAAFVELQHRIVDTGVSANIASALARGKLDLLTEAAGQSAMETLLDKARAAGVSDAGVEAFRNGDWTTLLDMGRKGALGELVALDRAGLLPPSVATRVQNGDVVGAVQALSRDRERHFDTLIAQQFGLPGGATLSEVVDPQWMDEQFRTVVSKNFKVLGQHVQLGTGETLADITPERLREVLYEAGAAVGWDDLADQMNVDVRLLQRFAQSSSRIQAFSSAARSFARRAGQGISERVRQLKANTELAKLRLRHSARP